MLYHPRSRSPKWMSPKEQFLLGLQGLEVLYKLRKECVFYVRAECEALGHHIGSRIDSLNIGYFTLVVARLQNEGHTRAFPPQKRKIDDKA